jgi:hypothetical protein
MPRFKGGSGCPVRPMHEDLLCNTEAHPCVISTAKCCGAGMLLPNPLHVVCLVSIICAAHASMHTICTCAPCRSQTPSVSCTHTHKHSTSPADFARWRIPSTCQMQRSAPHFSASWQAWPPQTYERIVCIHVSIVDRVYECMQTFMYICVHVCVYICTV